MWGAKPSGPPTSQRFSAKTCLDEPIRETYTALTRHVGFILEMLPPRLRGKLRLSGLTTELILR